MGPRNNIHPDYPEERYSGEGQSQSEPCKGNGIGLDKIGNLLAARNAGLNLANNLTVSLN
jgi:hypothetical protein